MKRQYNTKHRDALLTYLKSRPGIHMTAADVCSYFRAEGEAIGTTTVYRQLDRLVDEGIFTDFESAARYYEKMLASLVGEIDTMHQLEGYTNIVSYEDHKIIPKQEGVGYDLFLRMELLTPLTTRIREKITVDDVVSAMGCSRRLALC